MDKLKTTMNSEVSSTSALPGAYTIIMNTTDSTNGPPIDQCSTTYGHPVHHIIIAFLVGLVLGGVLYFLFLKFRKSRSRRIPARDYVDDRVIPDEEVDITPRFSSSDETKKVALLPLKKSDQNENSTIDSGRGSTGTGVSQEELNQHKKLERLSKMKPMIPPKPDTLNHQGSGQGNSDDSEEDSGHVYQEVNEPLFPGDSSTKTLAAPTNQIYSNTSSHAPLDQPYDSLVIIPEEVEYTNTHFNNYASLVDTPQTSSTA